jgi:hypothetical protein
MTVPPERQPDLEVVHEALGRGASSPPTNTWSWFARGSLLSGRRSRRG